MSDVVDEFVVKIKVDSEDYERGVDTVKTSNDQIHKGLDDTEKKFEKVTKQTKDNTKSIKDGSIELEKYAAGVRSILSGFARLGAVAMAGTGITALADKMANATIQVNNLGKNIGMSAKELRSWANATEQLGGDPEAMKSSLEGIQHKANMYIASGDHAMIEYLNKLNVPIAHVTPDGKEVARSSKEIMLDLADAFSKMDRPMAYSLAKEMGIDPSVFNVLAEGRGKFLKAVAYQNKMYFPDKDAIKEKEDFTESVTKTKHNTEALIDKWVDEKVMPVANPMLEKVNQYLEAEQQRTMSYFEEGMLHLLTFFGSKEYRNKTMGDAGDWVNEKLLTPMGVGNKEFHSTIKNNSIQPNNPDDGITITSDFLRNLFNLDGDKKSDSSKEKTSEETKEQDRKQETPNIFIQTGSFGGLFGSNLDGDKKGINSLTSAFSELAKTVKNEVNPPLKVLTAELSKISDIRTKEAITDVVSIPDVKPLGYLMPEEQSNYWEKEKPKKPKKNALTSEYDSYVVDTIMKMGELTPEQAIGLAANFKAESMYNPQAKGKEVGRDGEVYYSYGIAQWNKSRADDLAKYLHKNFDTDIANSTLEQQISFSLWELENKYAGIWRDLKKTKTADEATELITRKYERPAKVDLRVAERQEMARNIQKGVYSPDSTIEVASGEKQKLSHQADIAKLNGFDPTGLLAGMRVMQMPSSTYNTINNHNNDVKIQSIQINSSAQTYAGLGEDIAEGMKSRLDINQVMTGQS